MLRHTLVFLLLLAWVSACSSPSKGSSDGIVGSDVASDAALTSETETPTIPADAIADVVIPADKGVVADVGNQNPVIQPLENVSVHVGGSATLTVNATDPDGDTLSYSWDAGGGTVVGTGASVTFLAPAQAGDVTVTVTVTDGRSGKSETSLTVHVGSPTSFSTPVPLTDGSTNSKTPSMAFLKDEGHLVWATFVSGPPAALYHARLKGGSWTTTRLTLFSEHQTSPYLFVVGTTLHLFWNRSEGDVQAVYHSSWSGAEWNTPQRVGTGWRSSAAVDGTGNLHLVLFADNKPVHYRYDGAKWSAGDAITLPHDYLNALRLKLLGGETLQLALSTSPGNNAGYRIRLFLWSKSVGWSGGTDAQLLNPNGLSSDDMDGALDTSGKPFWVWTEQTPEDEWTFAIRTKRTGGALSWAGKTKGSNFVPTVVIPGDNRAIVAWISESSGLQLAREPFGSVVDLGGNDPYGPSLALDARGFTHLVFYGRDAQGVQQVWYSHNIPE